MSSPIVCFSMSLRHCHSFPLRFNLNFCHFPFPLSPVFSYYSDLLYFLWAVSHPFSLFDTTLSSVPIVRNHMATLRHFLNESCWSGWQRKFHNWGATLAPNPCLRILLNDWIPGLQSLTELLTVNLLGCFGKACCFLLCVQCHLCCHGLCFFNYRQVLLLSWVWGSLSCVLQNPGFCNFVIPWDNVRFAASVLSLSGSFFLLLAKYYLNNFPIEKHKWSTWDCRFSCTSFLLITEYVRLFLSLVYFSLWFYFGVNKVFLFCFVFINFFPVTCILW